jgi:hypothetical protein
LDRNGAFPILGAGGQEGLGRGYSFEQLSFVPVFGNTGGEASHGEEKYEDRAAPGRLIGSPAERQKG